MKGLLHGAAAPHKPRPKEIAQIELKDHID